MKAVRHKRVAIVNRLYVPAASASQGRSLTAEAEGFREGSPLDIGCKERGARRLASANLTAAIASRRENAGLSDCLGQVKEPSSEKTTQLESVGSC